MSAPRLERAAFVVGVTVSPLVVFSLLHAAGADYLRVYGVDHLPGFYDLRNLLVDVTCARRGFDPYRQTACNAGFIRLDYPRLWLNLFDLLGLQRRDASTIAVVMIGTFLASVALVVRTAPRTIGLWLAVVCSPAVLFAIDRGNNELVIFALVAVATLAAPRHPIAMPLWATSVLLKLFPAVIAPVFCRQRWRTLATLAILGVVGIYVVVSRHDIVSITKAVDKGRKAVDSYGSRLVVAELGGWHHPGTVPGGVAALAAGLIAVVTLAVTLVVARHRPPLTPGPATQLFMAGSLIYVGTFLLEVNWNYRLIFLILCLPQVIDGWDDGLLPKVLGGMIVLVCWSGSVWVLRAPFFAQPLHAVATWSLFVTLVLAWGRGWFLVPSLARSPEAPAPASAGPEITDLDPARGAADR